MYNKAQAAKMLKEDGRINSVKQTSRGITIITNPINPVPKGRKYKGVFLCSIGCFKIRISQRVGEEVLRVYLKRVNGGVGGGEGVHHYHIKDHWGNKICWGSAEDDVYIMKHNLDWYWLARTILDLLEDGDPERGETEAFYYDMIRLQAKWATEIRNNKLIPKLEKLHKKYNRRGELVEFSGKIKKDAIKILKPYIKVKK